MVSLLKTVSSCGATRAAILSLSIGLGALGIVPANATTIFIDEGDAASGTLRFNPPGINPPAPEFSDLNAAPRCCHFIWRGQAPSEERACPASTACVSCSRICRPSNLPHFGSSSCDNRHKLGFQNPIIFWTPRDRRPPRTTLSKKHATGTFFYLPLTVGLKKPSVR